MAAVDECSEQLNNFLILNGDEFRWNGTLDQLKRYFTQGLNLCGKWNSPSGGVWLFSTKEFEVKWQKSLKLVIVRDSADKFMLNCFMNSLAKDNHTDRPDTDSNPSIVEEATSFGDDYVVKFEASVNNKLDCILKALNDFKQISILQEENKSLRKSLDELSHQHKNLMCVASDLNTRIKDLEDEKSSLLTALKLVYCKTCKFDIESNSHTETDQSKIIDSDPSLSSKDPLVHVIDLEKSEESGINESQHAKKRKKHKSKKKSNNKDSTIPHINSTVNQQNDNSSAHPSRGSNNAQANPPNNIESNYHSDLGVNQNIQSVDAQNNLNQSDGDVNYHDQSMGGFSKHDKKSKHKPKKKVTVIAGDSILKHLQGWKLSDINNHVVVKSFAGATIEDMEDYLKPVIRKEPETIVLHIGTNDLRNLSPKQVAEGITNLGSQMKNLQILTLSYLVYY